MNSRKMKLTVVFLCLIFLLSGIASFAQEQSPAPSQSDTNKAVDLLKKVWETNQRINKYEGNIVLVRTSGDMLKGVFPPMDPRYVQAKGIINYTNKPQMMQLMLYPSKGREFFYNFFTNDGFQVTLKPGYEKFLQEIGADTKSPGAEPSAEMSPSPSPSATDFMATISPEISPTDSASPAEASPTPSPEETQFYDFPELGNLFKPEKKMDDGTLIFARTCPINLLFPFTFKTIDPHAKIKYVGTSTSQGFRCHVIEMDSSQNGIYHIYITDDKDNYIVQIDQKTPGGVIYASAYYSDFKMFRKGGWFHQNVKLIVLSQSVTQGVLSDIKTNNDIIGEPVETPVTRVVKPPIKNGDPISFAPIWTASIIAMIIILLAVLTFFFYRYLFYKAKREPFAREVIVVEGERAEEKISHTLADLGIPSTAFTSEKLTEERKLLDQKQGGKRPRVVVIAPGMFPQVKPFNFLIKAYVQDGGRVIIFEHGVEQTNDMPFTPTFMPYDKTDPNLTFMVHPQWEKMWRQTSPDEIKKRTAAFNPYELIAKIKEQSVDIEPIIYVHNPKGDFNALAVALLKEGKGEYMIVQYRLIEAIKKLKFTSATAEKMLMDIMSYMFGDEKRIEIAPDWLLNLFGLKPPKQVVEDKKKGPAKK